MDRGTEHNVYVLQNGNPVERSIKIGLRTEEFVEVLEGLSEGERVVLSNLSSVEDLEELEEEE